MLHKAAKEILIHKYNMSFDPLESCTPVFPGSVGRWPSSAEAAALKSIHKMKQPYIFVI